MRTKHPNILHCSLVGAAIATLCALPATAQDTVKLKFADWLPPTHYTSAEGAVVLIEKAKELAGDSLQIDYFPAEQLGKGADMLRLGQSGIAEIVNIAPAYITEKFPLSGVAELPNIYQQSCDGSLAFDELATGDGILAESEWKPNGMKVLFVGGLGAYRLLTAEKQVNTAADIEGLKLRTAGGAMDMTAAAMKARRLRKTCSGVISDGEILVILSLPCHSIRWAWLLFMPVCPALAFYGRNVTPGLTGCYGFLT